MLSKQDTSRKFPVNINVTFDSYREVYFIVSLNTFVSYVAQVFSGCGKPLLGRRRRDTTELEFESLQFGRSEDAQGGESNIVPTLDKLVKDIRQKVQCSMYCFYVASAVCGYYISVESRHKINVRK
jgi:hypothetical protein